MRAAILTGGLVVLFVSAVHAQQPGAPDGAQLFARSCASCHGATGVPNPRMVTALGAIPDLSDARTMTALTDSAIGYSIVNGKGRSMRAPRTPYTAEQLRVLVAYVRTLSRR